VIFLFSSKTLTLMQTFIEHRKVVYGEISSKQLFYFHKNRKYDARFVIIE